MEMGRLKTSRMKRGGGASPGTVKPTWRPGTTLPLCVVDPEIDPRAILQAADTGSGVMVKNQGRKCTQANNLNKYTITMPAPGAETGIVDVGGDTEGGPTNHNHSLRENMEAIPSLRGTLETKLDAVNLLKADLRKVTEKVTMAETQINGLESVTKRVKDQVQTLTKQNSFIAAKVEDQEGRARHNNIQVSGIPEGAAGPSMKLFMVDLILKN
ncbi:hypothetical protein NDU88_000764 [Pleurodeles waltl]|uniref:Uncharacterized protein n=1 Tax=Pleurodeles waltl TaxID=8319 RepID=A0AAV7VZG1_PLEWA|nr:hypothetical protein NDU88_000764 [Pleurodeles waltl]